LHRCISRGNVGQKNGREASLRSIPASIFNKQVAEKLQLFGESGQPVKPILF
jgi:hypothetical protein